MIRYILPILLIISTSLAKGQNTRIETNIYYGIQNNFFVDYDRTVDKSEGYFQPIQEIGYDFYQKNSIGTIYGATVFYIFNSKNKIGVDFNKTENNGRYNFSGSVTECMLL